MIINWTILSNPWGRRDFNKNDGDRVALTESLDSAPCKSKIYCSYPHTVHNITNRRIYMFQDMQYDFEISAVFLINTLRKVIHINNKNSHCLFSRYETLDDQSDA
jgi:hypothetical protein